jgi:CDP-glucose 4,6-dehydratase
MINLKSFYRNKKVVITGNTGFKGSWLSLILYNLGAKVYGYSLKPQTNPSNFHLFNLSKIVKYVNDDVRNYKKFYKFFKIFFV